MDERRHFFRIKNKGEIQITIADEALDVIDISSTGVLVIKKKTDFPQQGMLALKIHNFSMNLHYTILKTEKDTMVLVFNVENEINTLFAVLKNLRDEQNKQPPL
jgi:hypothetical protein